LEPRAFVAAAAIGIVIWNTPFLTLGYALRGSGHDPVSVGFWVAAVMIAVEAAIILGLRLYKRSIASPRLARPRAVAAPVLAEEVV
jgi:alkaline phosphatase